MGNLKGSYHLSDGPAGRQIAASLYDLHFGSFGGWPVKLIYAILGFGLTVMISAGMDIWLTKSAEKGKPRPLVHRLWTVLIYGAPAMIALTFAISMGFTGAGLPVPPVPVFWTGMVLMTAVTFVSYRFSQAAVTEVSRLMRITLGLSLIAMAGVHQAVHASGTIAALQVNIVLILMGLGFTATAFHGWLRVRKAMMLQIGQ